MLNKEQLKLNTNISFEITFKQGVLLGPNDSKVIQNVQNSLKDVFNKLKNYTWEHESFSLSSISFAKGTSFSKKGYMILPFVDKDIITTTFSNEILLMESVENIKINIAYYKKTKDYKNTLKK